VQAQYEKQSFAFGWQHEHPCQQISGYYHLSDLAPETKSKALHTKRSRQCQPILRLSSLTSITNMVITSTFVNTKHTTSECFTLDNSRTQKVLKLINIISNYCVAVNDVPFNIRMQFRFLRFTK